MNDAIRDAVATLVDQCATAETHEVTLPTDAYLTRLEQADPRTPAVQAAIDAFGQLGEERSKITRSQLTELLTDAPGPAKLALIFAWGSGNWALWQHNTRACLEQQAARCAGFGSNVESIEFLLDPSARFEHVESHARVHNGTVDPYDAFAKLWCPPKFRPALVPYAGTAFGTKLLYFAARRNNTTGVRPLIYDMRVAKSLREFDVRWSGGGESNQRFPLPTEVMPFACYDAYCRWCAAVAKALSEDGVTLGGEAPTADDIECWLWLLAGDVPEATTPAPDSPDDATRPAGFDPEAAQSEGEQPSDEPPAAKRTVKQAAHDVLQHAIHLHRQGARSDR